MKIGTMRMVFLKKTIADVIDIAKANGFRYYEFGHSGVTNQILVRNKNESILIGFDSSGISRKIERTANIF